MRILIAPDKFAGTLSAVEAAAAIAEGWRRTAPGDVLDLVPVADGGPGFLEVISASLGGETFAVTVTGPRGESVIANFLLAGGTAYIEGAQACGLHLIPEDLRDPTLTTTFGVGELVAAAVAAGASRIVVGLGGSGTNDAGAGLLAALGAVGWGAEGADRSDAMRSGGLGLRDVTRVDLSPAQARLAAVSITIASDVENPLLGLRGATNGFGPQKGATTEQVMLLEGSLQSFAAAVGRGPEGKDAAVALGSGAAGGLGYALLALGAVRVPGISTVLETVRLTDHVAVSDVVITGEGSFDWQSLRGKAVSGVAAAAMNQGRGCVVLAGRVEVGRREYAASGVSSAYSVVDDVVARGLPAESAFDRPGDRLADLAQRVARTWSR